MAIGGDEGAAWYNPAGLGSLHRTRLNANGAVFGVRVRPIHRGLTTSIAGLSSSVDYGKTDFVTTPTAASASFSLNPRFTMSGGLFHSSHDVHAASGVETVTGDAGRSLSQKVETLVQQRKMHMGGAYGLDAGHGVRIGSGMFAVYSARDSTANYAVSLDEGNGKPDIIAVTSTGGVAAWGLQPNFGVQWDVNERLHMGATERLLQLPRPA